jgi:transcriptional regulator with XRE-family HTH domain
MPTKGETFGETIRKLRKAAHKTLQEMADSLDVSVAYYSEVELGKRPPFKKTERIQILARKLNASASELLAIAWKDRKLITFDTEDLSAPETDILQSFARGGISKEQIGEIQEILKRTK